MPLSNVLYPATPTFNESERSNNRKQMQKNVVFLLLEVPQGMYANHLLKFRMLCSRSKSTQNSEKRFGFRFSPRDEKPQWWSGGKVLRGPCLKRTFKC